MDEGCMDKSIQGLASWQSSGSRPPKARLFYTKEK